MPQARLNSCLALIAMGLALAARASAQEGLLQLSIGDEARRDRHVNVALDVITDTATNATLAPQALVKQLRGRRLVLIGEQHTDLEYHTVELRVLERLEAAGVPLLIGLEMFPTDDQSVLDDWIGGRFTEAEFLAESDWYRTWGYHWGYYREIFELARDAGIRTIGLGERTAASAGHENLAVTSVAPESPDHRVLVEAFFEADSPVHGGMSEEQLDALVAAQSRRDATMARNAAEALDRAPGYVMVVLTGIGHVLYGLGIARQLPDRYRGSAASVLPVPVGADEETVVSAGVADFVWGVPIAVPRFPELGVVTVTTDNGLHVIYVEDDSSASVAGIEVGDNLTRLDDTLLEDRSDLGRALARFAWGDVIEVGITRDDEPRTLTVALRRASP